MITEEYILEVEKEIAEVDAKILQSTCTKCIRELLRERAFILKKLDDDIYTTSTDIPTGDI